METGLKSTTGDTWFGYFTGGGGEGGTPHGDEAPARKSSNWDRQHNSHICSTNKEKSVLGGDKTTTCDGQRGDGDHEVETSRMSLQKLTRCRHLAPC